jgi:S1-C subfamily serine protease
MPTFVAAASSGWLVDGGWFGAEVRMRNVTAVLVTAILTSGNAFGAFGQNALELRGAGSQIGVGISDRSEGVAITEVRAQTPAARAGFKNGDLVLEFDGQTIRTARQFTRVVQETPPGKAVTAVVLRDGSRQTLTVTPETGRATDYRRRLPDVTADLRRRLPGIAAIVAADLRWYRGELQLLVEADLQVRL